MLLLVEFDFNADIIDVPKEVIDNRKQLNRACIEWLYSPAVKPRYTVTINGHRGLCYRSEAFAAFLNENLLKDSKQKAVIVEQYVPRDNKQNLPSVFF